MHIRFANAFEPFAKTRTQLISTFSEKSLRSVQDTHQHELQIVILYKLDATTSCHLKWILDMY